jgi:hypothetical protein
MRKLPKAHWRPPGGGWTIMLAYTHIYRFNFKSILEAFLLLFNTVSFLERLKIIEDLNESQRVYEHKF